MAGEQDVERIEWVTFPSAGSRPVQIEGAFHPPQGKGQCPAAVVCHPHPLGGGTMHNSVVKAITRALVDRGIATLRFNFRGVERSEGRYDNGRNEQADVAGALDWLLTQGRVDPGRVSVVGYSFVAWVGLMHAQTDRRVGAAAAVALVAWHDDTDFYRVTAGYPATSEFEQFDLDFMQGFTCPKLFVSGERDWFISPEAIRNFVDRLPPPKMLKIIPGADHFFSNHEQEVGQQVAEFIANVQFC
jgi:alpha/beta superfamily hydrolase